MTSRIRVICTSMLELIFTFRKTRFEEFAWFFFLLTLLKHTLELMGKQKSTNFIFCVLKISPDTDLWNSHKWLILWWVEKIIINCKKEQIFRGLVDHSLTNCVMIGPIFVSISFLKFKSQSKVLFMNPSFSNFFLYLSTKSKDL
jgi:hypothetical protein